MSASTERIHPVFKEIQAKLPPVREVEARTEADYYGASYLIASQLGLREPPEPLAIWVHGARMREMITPAEVAWMKNPSRYKIVHTEKDAEFCRAGGLTGLRVAGAPFLYTDALERFPRIPNSILIMPAHSIRETEHDWDCSGYAELAAKLKERYDFVAACIYHSCIDKGLWIHDFERMGIPCFRGAQSDDMNALVRMRALFDSFEHMTTNAIGSNIPYMLYAGGKVSIWGKMVNYERKDFDGNLFYQRNPEVLDRFLEWCPEENLRREFPELFREPWDPFGDKAWADEMLGLEFKKPVKKLKRYLGWGADQMLFERLRRKREAAGKVREERNKAKLKEKNRIRKKKLQHAELRKERKRREREEKRKR